MPKVDRTTLPEVGADPTFRLPEFHRASLDNGARVWAAEHRRAPVLTLLLLLPVGAAVDPPDAAGLAALTGDLLDEGSEARSAEDLHRALARIGGHLSTDVWSDATVLGLTILSRHMQEGLRLLFEIATQPRFDSDDVGRVRDLRLHGIRQIRRAPSTMADRVFLETLYRSHPYGHLAIGTDASLRRIGSTEVRDFHRRWYTPSTSTLIAVGDVNSEDLLAKAELAWMESGGHDSRPCSRPTLPEPPPVRRRIVFVGREESVQSEIRLGHVGVSRSSPDYHALRVLNAVLGGQFVSRINLNLREDKGYTYGARTSFDWRVGRGPFSLQVSVQTAATVDAIREASKELSDIRESRPPTTQELDLARAALTRGFPRSFESAAQIARAGVQLALHHLSDDDYSQFVPRIMSVDADDVLRVASQHLRPDALIAVVVGSRSDVFDKLGRLGFGEPTERSDT